MGAFGTIRSGGVPQAFSGAELIEGATGLTLAIFGLLGMGHDWSSDEGNGSSGDSSTHPPFPTPKIVGKFIWPEWRCSASGCLPC